MKKTVNKNYYSIVATRNNTSNMKVDYYIVSNRTNERMYAFTRSYTDGTYKLCRSGIGLDDLLTYKCRQFDIMTLVKYVNHMMPYLTEYYDLQVA